MTEWKKLYEIEDFRDKDLEYIDYNYNDDGTTRIDRCWVDKTYGYIYCGQRGEKNKGHICFGTQFDKPLWREAQPDLPTYDDWFDTHYCHQSILTSKELLRRYIQHLADIVNDGWVPDLKSKVQKKYYIFFNSENVFSVWVHVHVFINVIYFESEDAARRVIDNASQELLELFGVEDE